MANPLDALPRSVAPIEVANLSPCLSGYSLVFPDIRVEAALPSVVIEWLHHNPEYNQPVTLADAIERLYLGSDDGEEFLDHLSFVLVELFPTWDDVAPIAGALGASRREMLYCERHHIAPSWTRVSLALSYGPEHDTASDEDELHGDAWESLCDNAAARVRCRIIEYLKTESP